MSFGVGETWIHMLALSFGSHVTLNKLPDIEHLDFLISKCEGEHSLVKTVVS